MRPFKILIFVFLTPIFIFAEEPKPTIRTKFENSRCFQATDNSDGRPLRWLTVDLSRCGFNTSKPFRKEMILLNGSTCAEVHIWDSATGYGQYKEVLSLLKLGTAALKLCGYDLDQPVVNYQLSNGSECKEYLKVRSSFANMPDVQIVDPKRNSTVNPELCGFKPENSRTIYELENNKCYQLQVNFNSSGVRITNSRKEVDLDSCGIDLKDAPATVVYSKTQKLTVWSFGSDFNCGKIESFVSKKGLGIYQLYTKADAEKCESARTKPSEQRTESSRSTR